MPADDLALLEAAAQAAGEIANRHFEGPRTARDKPGGQGPVTDADLEIDGMLRAELGASRPDYGWLSEETEDDKRRLSAKRVFVVDPIDGTRAFIAGRRSWGHALAVVEAGNVTAGVVHMPRLARTYTASLGAGAHCNGAPIAPSDRADAAGATALVSRSHLAPERWPGGAPALEPHFCPSLAYRICLAAEGRYDAALTLRPAWEWDVAAATLIAAEAGAGVSDADGARLIFNNPVPKLAGVMVAGPELYADLIERRAPPTGRMAGRRH